MKRKILFILAWFLLPGILFASYADHSPGFNISDASSVDDAVAQIKAALVKQDYEITAVINHAQNADNIGQILRPTQVIMFRKRFFDGRLILRRQSTAIDLPLKILVYEDAVGNIKLKSNDVGYLIDRHEINIHELVLYLLDLTMDQFGKNDKGIIMVPSNQSVKDTVNKLKSVLTDAGFFIPIEITFNDEIRRLRDTTLLVFGNPAIGTQLMQNRQEIGLDLPQKFLIFEDREGQVKIAYNDPQFIAQRAGIQGLEMLLANIANALNNFARQGSAR
jgi:uncharacterized protein (DUF302 family)